MADGTKIEWTDATVNAVNGCSVVSPGCTNCYAMRLAGTRLRNHASRAGLTRQTKAGPVWTGEVRLNEKALFEPLHWRKPRTIFWNAHGDLFHPAVPDAWIDRVFAVAAATPHHIHQVLTKRSDRMRQYLSARKARKPVMVPLGDGTLEQHPFNSELQPPTNIWLGVSVEDQRRADERIPDLLATPAAVRFLSCEPLLGAVDLAAFMAAVHHHPDNSDRNSAAMLALIKAARDQLGGGIDWVICGGESGPGARPMHPDWARSLRDQCAAAGVPFFFKQWGVWAPVGRLQDDAGDTEETIAAETAMMDAMRTLPDGNDWIDPSRLQLVDSGMHNWANDQAQPAPDALVIKRIGKQAAGRLLDGVTHDGMPSIPRNSP